MSSKIVQAWIQKAEDNILYAKDALKNNHYELVCFFSEQAIEIVMKGYLYSKRVLAPKTHKLMVLYLECQKNGLEVDVDPAMLKKATEYYVESRYPDVESREFTKELGQEALLFAQKAVREIKEVVFVDK